MEQPTDGSAWINTHIWQDERFRAMSPFGSLLFFQLATPPHGSAWDIPYPCTLQDLADAGYGELEELQRSFEEARGQGFVNMDAEGHIVLLPAFLAFISPVNPTPVECPPIASTDVDD